MRILLCGAQVPFARGGAELLLESLRTELVARGHEVDQVAIPYSWQERIDVLRSGLVWRLLDLEKVAGERVDLVIATRFPSYLVRHPNKVVWLVHQLRQAYDLKGTPYSDFTDSPRDRRVVEMLRTMDRRTLGEARALFSISRNTAERLAQHNGLQAQVLYPPPKLAAQQRAAGPGEFGDYVFTAGRLDPLKRLDLLLRAMAATQSQVRCRIAGTGPERAALVELAARLGIASRVDFLGWVADAELPALYRESLAVYYAPYDEDYGYVTVEAFLSGKPVVTLADSGGVLEFVTDDVTGFVCAPADQRAVALRFDQLFRDRDRARILGEAGQRRVAPIEWDSTIARLTLQQAQ